MIMKLVSMCVCGKLCSCMKVNLSKWLTLNNDQFYHVNYHAHPARWLHCVKIIVGLICGSLDKIVSVIETTMVFVVILRRFGNLATFWITFGRRHVAPYCFSHWMAVLHCAYLPSCQYLVQCGNLKLNVGCHRWGGRLWGGRLWARMIQLMVDFELRAFSD
jgi:hypothetical protein